ERAARRFRRLLEAAAANVVQPAVEWASNTAVLDSAVGQFRQAMRAAQPEQPWLPIRVTKEHQVLAEYANLQRFRARSHLPRQPHRVPVAPHVLAARRPAIRPTEKLVFLLSQHRGTPFCWGGT